MTYSEDDLLPLSGLQHILFCERQCALIHIEQLWNENVYTAEGRILHERVHDPERISRGDIRIEYSVPLRSFSLGVIGKADVVEFHRPKENGEQQWIPFPVEYKRGRPKKGNFDRVQLCAQAICMEEMLGVNVTNGALFYGKTRRRENVDFNGMLRDETVNAAQRFHELMASGKTPMPEYGRKCDTCSFIDICMPKTMKRAVSVNQYFLKTIGKP